MVPRLTLEFIESFTPIRDLVTKFGGQPTWVSQPEWPISRKTGKPMRFIGQVALDREIFGEITGQMAYVFMTDDQEDWVDGTWEADGGENAVVIQPGTVAVSTQAIVDGPSLYRMADRPGLDRLVPEPCEFRVDFVRSEDPDFISEDEIRKRSTDANDAYYKAITGNKVGGTPGFMQGDEFPGAEFRQLILQLDSTLVPFDVNFGDAGTGYVFLSNDGRAGKFIWQCA